MTITALIIILAFACALYGAVKSNIQAVAIGLVLVCVVLLVPIVGGR